MKKNLVLFVITLLAINVSNAQTEIKINPVNLLFKNIDLGVEFGISEDFGIEVRPGFDFGGFDVGGLSYTSSRFQIITEGKYYFAPNKGIDKFYADLYIKFRTGSSKTNDGSVITKANSTRLAVGFGGGYKWVSSKNIIFELGFGMGRAFINEWKSDDDSIDLSDFPILNLDLTGKLAVGYRF